MTVWGERLRSLRSEAGLSQGQLAAYTGVSHSTLSDIETGKIAPKTIDVLIKLIGYHKTSADYVMGFSENRYRKDDAGVVVLPARSETEADHLRRAAKIISSLDVYGQEKALELLELINNSNTPRIIGDDPDPPSP